MIEIKGFLNNIEKSNLNLKYLHIVQNGEVEHYWNKFEKEYRIEAYSVSKSFVSMAIGIALEDGILSLNEKITNSFLEYTYNIYNPNVLDITVKNLLTMSTGLENPLFFRDDPERLKVKNWLEYFFRVGTFNEKPGEKFLYSNFNTYLLSCLIENKTGLNLLEFMRYRLFEPIGIGNPDMANCPMGHTVGANGLSINIQELSNFGQMMLNKGEFKGKRIVPEKYIEDAITPKIKTDKKIFLGDNRCFDYGYQLFIDTMNKCYMASGLMGQFCIVLPEHDTVISVMSFDERSEDIEKYIWEDLISQFK